MRLVLRTLLVAYGCLASGCASVPDETLLLARDGETTQTEKHCTRVFFGDDDFALYIDLLSAAARKAGTEIWCYCIMPNHVHLIALPSDKESLRDTFADAHRRYTGYINAGLKVTGHS